MPAATLRTMVVGKLRVPKRAAGTRSVPATLRASLAGAAALAAIFSLCLTERAYPVEIIGHRGASHDAPENTLAAVRLAWERGADAVEIDVRLTRDGRIVVMHDESTERTTGREGTVAEMTLEELRRLDAGSWKGDAWQGEKIPTLEEVLATVPDGRRLFIEVKCGREIVAELHRVLEASGKRPEQTVVIAFDLDVATAVKNGNRKLSVYWLHGTSPKRDEKTGRPGPTPEQLVGRCLQAKLDGLDLAHDSRIHRRLIDWMHSLGLELYVWTVNSPDDVESFAGMGVDGVTTDRPGWMREQLGPPERSPGALGESSQKQNPKP